MTNKPGIKAKMSTIEIETNELNIVKPDGRELFDFVEDLKSEVSALTKEVSELKQKLEEK